MRNHQRTARGEAEFVLPLKRYIFGEETSRIQNIVAEIFISIAVEIIGSGLGDERHERSAGQAVFRRNAIHNSKLANVFYRGRSLCDATHRSVVFGWRSINDDLAVHPHTAHYVVLEAGIRHAWD